MQTSDATDLLAGLHVASDAVLFASYLAVPLGLCWLMWRRRDVPCPLPTALFAAFVLMCGFGHLLEAVDHWHPAGVLADWWKPATAVAAAVAAGYLLRHAPRLLALPDVERLNRQLREERCVLDSVIAASPFAIFWKSRDGIYLGCNPVFAEDVGLSDPSGVVGKSDLELGFDAAEAEHYRSWDRRVMAGERVFNLEETMTGGGETRTLLTSKVALRDADGRVSGMMGLYNDITDRKRDEQRLRTSLMELADSHAETAKLSLVAAKTRHSVVITDAAGRTEWVNPAFTRMTGYTLDDMAGKKPGTVLQGPDTDPAVKRMIGEKIRRRESVTAEIVNYCKEGIGYPIALEVEPVFDAAGELTNFVATQLDLRERKSQEAALREAKNSAEAANDAKSNFLANMSHEIRTPLGGILGFTDVLRRAAEAGEDDADLRLDHLDTIRTSGQHLLTLINDILDLSKIEAGRMEFDLAPCRPHAVVAEVLSVLRVRANEKGLGLDLTWVGAVPETIETDAARLRQLVTNLVGNAIKFTEAGLVRIVAEVLRDGDGDSGTPLLTVEVHDTGPGVPADKLATIFEPFSQADASVTRRHGGTGLGLAISRRIAEGLGGTLTATSRLGAGSVFRATVATGPLEGVTFSDGPLDETFGDRHAPTDGRRAAAPAGPLSGDVLLVEDGEVNRKLISLVLRRAGATVHCEENGKDGSDAALAAAEDGCGFDVVLLDMQMPVMDGYTAARRLRTAGYAGPIVALTAHAMKGDRERCLAAGCDDYLSKPIDTDALLAVVAGHLAADHGATRDGSPDGDAEFAALSREFLAETPARLAACRDAGANGDWAELSRLAHAWKGTGGTLGFDQFTAPTALLEAAADAGETDRIGPTLDELAELVDAAMGGDSAG